MKIKVKPISQIGIYPYSVNLVKDLKLNQGCWGVTNFPLRTIQIDAGLDDLEIMQTFVHENVHIISHNYQCSIDEENAERLANGFCEFLMGLEVQLDFSDISVVE